MKVLVTGAAGFLGSHLCDRLIADGHDVVGLDNYFTGSRENVAHLDRHPRFQMVRGDVCEPFHFEVDIVFHLACPASPVAYQKNPSRTIETGLVGTLNALKLAREVGATLVVTSTSEVYGDPHVHPQPESYWGNVDQLSPRACYDESKRCAESLCLAWSEQWGVDVRVARLFNVYGPRMASGDGRLLPNFITQALRGEPLTVYGDGMQTRSLCYVDDVVEALVRLGDARWSGDNRVLLREEMPVPVVNVGRPDERSVLDVAKQVLLTVHGSPLDLDALIRHLPALPADPRQRKPDIARARRVLGWEPTTSLDDGLGRTVEWFRQRVGARTLLDIPEAPFRNAMFELEQICFRDGNPPSRWLMRKELATRARAILVVDGSSGDMSWKGVRISFDERLSANVVVAYDMVGPVGGGPREIARVEVPDFY